MVVALSNKVWLNNGGGGGNGYHSNWLGPDALGRTVAAIGVDQAQLLQSQSLTSRPDLAWQLESGQEEDEALKALYDCVKAECCTQAGGRAEEVRGGLILSINGTDMSSAQITIY